MPAAITDSGFTTKDSSEVFKYIINYGDALAVGVELASVGTFTIAGSGLTQANQVLEAGNRAASVFLTGGTVGRTYTIEHTVQTNEAIPQTFSPWFRLRIT